VVAYVLHLLLALPHLQLDVTQEAVVQLVLHQDRRQLETEQPRVVRLEEMVLLFLQLSVLAMALEVVVEIDIQIQLLEMLRA
jgi:hypothetical protein